MVTERFPDQPLDAISGSGPPAVLLCDGKSKARLRTTRRNAQYREESVPAAAGAFENGGVVGGVAEAITASESAVAVIAGGWRGAGLVRCVWPGCRLTA